MYKKASQLKLRFPTNLGPLSAEQLWDLTQTQLSNGIKEAKKVLKKNDADDDLAFLENVKEVDVVNQLRFDILKDVYLVNKKEAADLRDAAAVKAHNQKIDALILKKREGEYEEMSVEELEALRK